MRQRSVSYRSLRCAAVFYCSAFLAAAQVVPESYYQDLLGKYAGHFSECIEQEKAGSAHAVNVAIVLDVSGPTKAQMAGGATLDVLRASALRFARALPTNVNVSLIVYGHAGDMTLMGKDESCKAVAVLAPAGPYRAAAISPIVERLKPGGWTPLQGALRKAFQSFAGVSDLFTDNRIFLLAAGMDTCGGRPREAARIIHTEQARTVINVVAVSASEAEQDELKAVATAGGGEFAPAVNPAALNRYFDNQTKLIRETYKQNRVAPACFETRLTAERSAIQHNLLQDSTSVPPRISEDVVRFVNSRLQQRQDKIRALTAKPDLTPEAIDRAVREMP